MKPHTKLWLFKQYILYFLYIHLFIQSIYCRYFLRNSHTLFSASFFFCFWGILEFFFPVSSSLRASLNRDIFYPKNRSHRTHTLCLLSNKMTHQPHNKQIHTFTIAEKFFILTFIFHPLLFTFCLLFKSHNKILKIIYSHSLLWHSANLNGAFISVSPSRALPFLSRIHSFSCGLKGLAIKPLMMMNKRELEKGVKYLYLGAQPKPPTHCVPALSLSLSLTHPHTPAGL